MNIPFDEINQALEAEFGPGVVRLKDGWGDYPYALRFEEDDPAEETVDRATGIVDSFIMTAWDYEAMRITTPCKP